MTKNVSIVDYGVGNILSVQRAVEAAGGVPHLTTSPEDLLKADSVILPGVGAFADAMSGLVAGGYKEALIEFAASGKPFLGICVGMQMLSDASHEFGVTEGLGLIPGIVDAIPHTDTNGQKHKIPHIGWNSLTAPNGNWDDMPLFKGLDEGCFTYFVHSFHATPVDPTHVAAISTYGGHAITGVVAKDNVMGTQFHPEKSAAVGLKMLENFIAL